jgi:peptidoglycan-N-acetylglucosamine deacetylase
MKYFNSIPSYISVLFKRIIILINFLLFFAVAAEGHIYDLDLNLVPARWPGNKDAALTLTFDDGYYCQFTKGISLLKKYDLPATFFIISGFIDKKVDGMTWNMVRDAAAQGYEIGSHTVNHANLITLENNKHNSDSLTWEVQYSQQVIDQQVPSQKCLSFCYPWCKRDKNTDKIVSDNYIGARSSGYWEGFSPDNLYGIKGRVIYSYQTAEQLNFEISDFIRESGWYVDIIHGIDNQGWEPLTYNTYDQHFAYIKQNQEHLWVATFQNVIKYISERNNVLFREESVSPDKISFIASDNLPDNIYYYPLSIRMNLPKNLDSADHALQNGNILHIKNYNEGDFRYVLIDGVIPDGGTVTIYLRKCINNILAGLNPNFTSYFDQYHNMFIIQNPANVEIFNVSIMSLNGIIIEENPINYISDYYEINLATKPKGMYFVVVSTKEGNLVRKFVIT